jgi:hypothetical protein
MAEGHLPAPSPVNKKGHYDEDFFDFGSEVK